MVQWRDIAPARGTFVWRRLDDGLKFFAGINRPTTVQMNANKKPDWLWSFIAQAGKDRKGRLVPQFWDPRYLEIQRELITAFAEHLKASPYREQILCVRASYNAIGTEHTWVQKGQQRPGPGWTFPPDGHRCPEPWSREARDRYCQAIMQTYLDAFAPEIPVALRANLFTGMGGDRRLLEKAGAWIFSTGTEADPRGKGTEALDAFTIEVARAGKTTAYWESWNRSSAYASPPSWNYWRLLLDLHKGVSYVAVYGDDIALGGENPEYRAAFDLVNRYAGYHTRPAEAPGAWCALREGEREPRGNYGWFLEQVDPDRTSVAVESDRGRKMIGPGEQRFGRFARRTDVASGRRRLLFRLDPRFRASMGRQPCRILVWYLDEGGGRWSLTWGERSTDRLTVRKAGSDRWKQAAVDVRGSALRGRLELRSDIVLAAAGRDDTTFHMVELTRRSRD